MAKNEFSIIDQFNMVKKEYPDCIIFFRLGDFYELFEDDAVLMSSELDLTLTSKSHNGGQKSPMCGVPVKSVDIYIAKAIEKGYKLAICEQLTEAKPGVKIERDVVRVITPGTIMEESILDERKNNFIVCFYANKTTGYSIAWCDITTGEFNVVDFNAKTNVEKINDILTMISPAEIICNSAGKLLEENITKNDRRELPTFTEYLDKHFNVQTAESLLLKQFKTQSLKAFDIDNLPNCIASCGALTQYFFETQKRSLNHIDKVKLVNYSNYMHIDFVSRKNLELTKNARDGGKTGTLLWYLDKTKTSMGARLLKKFIDEPLQKIEEIKLRQDGVEELLNNIIKREAIAKTLFNVKDLERLCGRISYNTLTPKDCITIKNSLLVLPTLKSLLQNTNSKVLKAIHNGISTHQNVIDLIERAINENDGNTATNLKEVGFINNGYSPELDELRNSAINGRSWILQLEKKEIEETKIKNLKIAYNRVFGYFIDVPNSQKNLVPFRYQRKQTLTSSERYTTEELTNLEEQIIGAEDKSLKLEQQLFVDLREKLLAFIPEIKETSTFIGYLDVLCSLAVVAAKNNLVKPEIVSEDEALVITDGKHPIVESIIKENFVPNNTLLDKNDNRTMVITGPNMAGKSTYMRQVAVIAIMAHIGSFVPAQQVQMPITDRIFTRIGATDDLALGQSTFMVEMTEVANILHNATPNSLILLDEIGRGTSTYDGLSIAWAVMDYISQNLICKTLFSTHYHELTELEGNLKGIKNYRINVNEVDGKIIFLRKIVRGGANKSFGIEVASLAGLPQSVILKAKSILKNLELADVNKENLGNMVSKIQTDTEDLKISTEKMKSVAEQDVLDAIKEVVVEKITPFEAMSLIYDLKTKLENDKK